MRSHDPRANPIRKIESRQGGKGQGSISDWDPSGDLKFRIPSESESPSATSFHTVVAPESFRAERNQDEKKISLKKISLSIRIPIS